MGTREFVLFGTAHVATVVVSLVVIATGVHLLGALSDDAQQRASRWVGWLVVVNIFAWRGWFALTHQFRMGSDLPLAVCSVSAVLLAVYFWRPKQAIFDVIFYWILVGSSLALLVPDLTEPFPSLRFISLFVTHAVSLFGLIYLVVVRKETPSDEGYSLAARALAIYAIVVALPLDWALHANYVYMLSPPETQFALMKLLPPWPWYWFVLLAFFYGVFRFVHAMHAHYFTSMRASSKQYAE
ncbi:MAG: TIGR02206 family membrane protein [Gemmatimonadota bacterium]